MRGPDGEDADVARAPESLASDVLVRRVVAELHGRRVACAESCTGGMLSQRFARADGSAEWFPGGVVTYRSDAKRAVLGVAPGPVVNHATARRMAEGVAALFDCALAVSITGAAGPDPLDGMPPGTIFVGVFVDGVVESARHHLSGSPVEVCTTACEVALRDLRRALVGATEPAVTPRTR